jgi:hypothetical protein
MGTVPEVYMLEIPPYRLISLGEKYQKGEEKKEKYVKDKGVKDEGLREIEGKRVKKIQNWQKKPNRENEASKCLRILRGKTKFLYSGGCERVVEILFLDRLIDTYRYPYRWTGIS